MSISYCQKGFDDISRERARCQLSFGRRIATCVSSSLTKGEFRSDSYGKVIAKNHSKSYIFCAYFVQVGKKSRARPGTPFLQNRVPWDSSSIQNINRVAIPHCPPGSLFAQAWPTGCSKIDRSDRANGNFLVSDSPEAGS